MHTNDSRRRLCVFCGSRVGTRVEYVRAAREVGTLLARLGVGLVYGGGSIGLMGEVANAALRAGGEVIGVIPRWLDEREIGHTGITELRVVESMHERKAQMAELSDGFLALPGGLGTMEELFEVWTWAQLGIHHKPGGVLDVAGFFDPLLALVDHMCAQGFVPPAHRDWLAVEKDAERLVARLLDSAGERTADAARSRG